MVICHRHSSAMFSWPIFECMADAEGFRRPAPALPIATGAAFMHRKWLRRPDFDNIPKVVGFGVRCDFRRGNADSRLSRMPSACLRKICRLAK